MDEPTEDPPGSRPEGLTVDGLLKKITPTAWVTPTMAALILVGFGVELALGVSLTSPTGPQLLKAGGDFGPSFAEGDWWRVFTSTFLHAGPLHLAFNLWAFLSVGKVTERIYGSRAFLAIYLLSGLGGSLASLTWSPLVVGVGASGAIFGVFGALLAFMLLHRGVLPAAYLTQQRNSIVAFIGYNVVFGLSQKNTDMAAHAGGLVAGLCAGAILGRDLLQPGAQVARRLVGAVGFAILLGLTGLGVRAKVRREPAIRADLDASNGLAHLKAKEYAQAVESYGLAIAHEREPSWLFNRGLAYLQLEDTKHAEEDLREANGLRAMTNAQSLLCEIGVENTGGTPETVEPFVNDCTAAMVSEPDPRKKARLTTLRSLLLARQGHTEASSTDLDDALALDAHAELARSQRLRVRARGQKTAEAAADCEVLLGSAAAAPADVCLCAAIARESGDVESARARLARCLTATPDDVFGLRMRAQLAANEGRLTESRVDYDRLVALVPTDAAVLNSRAWLEVELGDFRAARADADRAVALELSSFNLGTRCFALVGLGELAAAHEDCRKAVALRPDSIEDRGMLAYLEKRYPEARRSWESASKDPVSARALAQWIARLPER